MHSLEGLLQKSASSHSHLCPRQILGVRIGLAGMKLLGFNELPAKKTLLVIAETDGCFVDGLSAASGCTVGHRTMRVEDFGKVAATFVSLQTGRAVRLAPVLDLRERAQAIASSEPRHYFAQLHAYRVMPDEDLLSIQEVVLNVPAERILSRPGIRVNCSVCGEEIINEREILHHQQVTCRACAGEGYYQPALMSPFAVSIKVWRAR